MASIEVRDAASIFGELKVFLLSKARSLCAENGAELVFLTFSGSTLYGTRVEGKSDADVRGLFLPSIRTLALEEAPKSLRFTTGGKESGNTSDDADIDLWSLQYWLLNLLPKGDMGALDLLFSPSHEACTLFRSPMLNAVFAAPLRLISTERGRGYAEYSLGQAKKYGIKGSHLGALRAADRFLSERRPGPEEHLSSYFQSLVEACNDERFCAVQDIKGRQMLRLCGKLHEGTIRVEEFARRVEADMGRFGERAREAERNRGMDLKALSHALRALMQMEELLTTGTIHFPLKGRGELISVKEGRIGRDEVESRILKYLAAVDALRETASFHGDPDADFARCCLMSCYNPPPKTVEISSPKTGSPVFAEGFTVPEATLEAIQNKLDAAETRYEIKILYACESGSRGWNFASRDSDYDVRFIYAHNRDWYLGVAPEEKPDNLDLGLENTSAGDLDVSGWELRKTLKLFRRSNGPLLEWLSSPLIYREKCPLARRLRELAPVCFSPVALWNHYRGS
jgi:predicted nucleotidyltransferase